MNHVLLTGATGLVGSHALSLLLERAERAPQHVLVAGRRPPGQSHPRLHSLRLDLTDAGSAAALAAASRALGTMQAFICCLGTTIRQAGSRPAFAAVDRDMVLRIAAVARDCGARQAVMVSAVGADPASGNFYLRTKGEAEAGLRAMGFERCDFLRPGLLIGPRGGEPRPGERLAQRLAPLVDLLLPGRLQRFQSIPATSVAAALVAALHHGPAGVFVHDNASIRALAAGLD
jgi:uncharacterized protein YbjT (DUF2867 family)